MAGSKFGGHAELVSVNADDLLPLPSFFSYEQGAAVPVNYATAYAGIVMMGGLRERDRLLIQAAARSASRLRKSLPGGRLTMETWAANLPRRYLSC